jgi:exosortase
MTIEIAGSHAERSLASKHASFLAICIAAALLSSHTWIEWWHLALTNNRYSYLLLIPLLSAGMIYRDRRQIFRERAADGTLLIRAGIASLAIACWFLADSGLLESFTLAVFAGVTFWVGTFRLFYGRQAWKAARFPILFLYSLVPIPGFVLERVIGSLQGGSAAVANGLLSLSSIPYFREGLAFHFQDLTVLVTEDCSGIRSSITLLLWVALQAHFSLRSGWRKLLFLSSVFPVVLFKNGLRIATLSILAVKVDSGFMTGWLHHDGGFVFFGLALSIEIALCRLLERSERRNSANVRCDVIPQPASQIAQEI